MSDDKLIDIETKLAHQEHLLEELNEVMTSQQTQISRLENICKSLIDRMHDMPESGASAGDEKPPHY